MVNQLIEISANHLDVPVAQLYQKAFQKGWERLDGRDDQLHVAQKSATTVKKLPEDM